MVRSWSRRSRGHGNGLRTPSQPGIRSQRRYLRAESRTVGAHRCDPRQLERGGQGCVMSESACGGERKKDGWPPSRAGTRSQVQERHIVMSVMTSLSLLENPHPSFTSFTNHPDMPKACYILEGRSTQQQTQPRFRILLHFHNTHRPKRTLLFCLFALDE